MHNVRIMIILTCNVRTAQADDGLNNWENRKDLCARVIASRNPDVIGFQEMDLIQFRDLQDRLSGYDSYGLGDTPVGYRPTNAIFFRRERFYFVTGGGYWLSETPHVAGSKSWDSVCVRLANWVRLVDRPSGREFRLINTHLDHMGQKARENQARLIMEDSAAYPDDFPQVLVGDMNCDDQNPALTQLLESSWRDTYTLANGGGENLPTFHEFKGEQDDGNRAKLDWILIRGKWGPVASADIVRDADEPLYPSDHYFVEARVTAYSEDSGS